jgi:hypothetical protein
MKFSIEESSSDEDNGTAGKHGQSNSKENRTNAMYSTSFPQIDSDKRKKNSKENSKNKTGVLGGLFNNSKNTKIAQSRNGENAEYSQVGVQSDDSDNENISVKSKKKSGRGSERGSSSGREEERDNSVNPFNRNR